MYRIREIDPIADEDAVEAIHCFNRQTCAFPPLDVETIENGWWWVAYLNKTPVAFAGLTRSYYMPPYTGYFKRAGVDPEHRGHGLQMRLIQVRLRKARKLGFVQVVTDTTDTVYSANNLYKAGFRMFEPEIPWMQYKQSLYWIRQL